MKLFNVSVHILKQKFYLIEFQVFDWKINVILNLFVLTLNASSFFADQVNKKSWHKRFTITSNLIEKNEFSIRTFENWTFLIVFHLKTILWILTPHLTSWTDILKQIGNPTNQLAWRFLMWRKHSIQNGMRGIDAQTIDI
jgi:hypothetical protein